MYYTRTVLVLLAERAIPFGASRGGARGVAFEGSAVGGQSFGAEAGWGGAWGGLHGALGQLNRFRLVVEHTSNMVVITDAQRRIEYVNPSYTRVTGWQLDEVRGRRPGEVLHGPLTCRNTTRQISERLGRGEPVHQVELVNHRKDGEPYWVQLNIQPVHDERGELTHYVAIQSDVTAQRRAREALEASERRLAEALRLARMASFECNFGEDELRWTAGAEAVLGAESGALPRSFAEHVDRIEGDDRDALMAAYLRVATDQLPYEVEYRIADAEGGARWIRERGYYLPADGHAPRRLCALVFDVSTSKAAQDRIAYLAWHDTLTGLANREQLQHLLRSRLDVARQQGRQLALLFADLDRFKTINDTLGHHVGDEVLKLCAQRLKDSIRSSDLVARLGGDEFVIVLADVDDTAVITRLGEKLLDVLSRPMLVHGRELHASASLGVSLYPQDGETVAELMRHADAAMYRAKAQGRRTLSFYSADLQVDNVQRFELESQLRLALPRREFRLHFQPQFTAADGGLVGFEALLRWRTPAGEWVPPDRFIPLAEEIGLIHEIGDWVLDEACRQWRCWAEMGASHLRVSVNLSAHQLRAHGLQERLCSLLAEHGLPAGVLELELTESVAMHDPASSIELMGLLRDSGISWAVDDFGTGYSSLAYLKSLPIQRIKLDRAFVRDLERSTDDQAICGAAIRLAHALGLELVAEGVETPEQHHFLRLHGCDVMQGYHLGRPMSDVDACALIQRHQAA